MSVDRFELQEREYEEKGAYHFSDLTLKTAEGIEASAKLELTLDTIRKFNSGLVVDFGCGEGVLVHMLRSKGVACIGLDLSRSALSLAQQPTKGFLVQANLEHTPLRDHSIGVVSMIAVLEHIPPQNIPNVLGETKRVIQTGGRLVIRVPSTNQPIEQKHYQHFTDRNLRDTLVSNGLRVEQIIGNHDTSQDWELYYSQMDHFNYENRYQIYKKVFAVCDPNKAKRLLAVCTNI